MPDSATVDVTTEGQLAVGSLRAVVWCVGPLNLVVAQQKHWLARSGAKLRKQGNGASVP